jgi:hypothetical protein
MVDYTHQIYGGTNYGNDPNYKNSIGGIPFSQMSTAVNAKTANQLKAVNDALNTGIKNVEVQLTFPEEASRVSTEHLKELNRLAELTGAELSLHAPMVETSGVNAQSGQWSEQNRIQAERIIWDAIERGRNVNIKKSFPVTIHASPALPEPEIKIKDEKGKEIVTAFSVYRPSDNRVGTIPLEREKDYLEGKKNLGPQEMLDKVNKESWDDKLQNLSFRVKQGEGIINGALGSAQGLDPMASDILKNNLQENYGDYINGNLKHKLGALDPVIANQVEEKMSEIAHGDLYLRDAYNNFKGTFNEAYRSAEENKNVKDLEKLNKFKKDIAGKIDLIKDPSKIGEFGETLVKGMNVLRSLSDAPKTLVPIREFAMDKSSETFSNLAMKSYKKFGDKAPIISMENHPVSETSGFYRAHDLKDLVEESRRKFVQKAVEEGIKESVAKKQAKKLIGVTWDVGHINVLKGRGYTDKDLMEEAKTVAPYLKHIHLADNLGIIDAELAMGMGNVPMKDYEKIFKKYGDGTDELKRVVEAFHSVSDFEGASPLPQAVSAYGSPVYAMEMAPYWNQVRGSMAGYYSGGYGQSLPDSSSYSTSFSGLPSDLGGNVGGGRSRFSGTPVD